MTTRVSLPGINALTDSQIDNYALYTDIDNILIKEHARGSTTVGASSSTNVAHGLGYTPMVFAFAERADGNTGTAGRWYYITGPDSFAGGCGIRVTTSNLVLVNLFTNSKPFKWYIFRDRQVI